MDAGICGRLKALVLDIDGVLTDGTIPADGSNDRRLFMRDLDALTRARDTGIRVAFLTGEPEASVGPVVARCGGGAAVYSAKDKERGLREISGMLETPVDQICYVGDARRDIPALQLAGLSLVPSDGDVHARAAADRVLASPGGRGAVAEAIDLLLADESG